MTSVILGARTTDQRRENSAAAELELTADEVGRLDAVSQPPLLHPYRREASTAADRLSAADLTLLGRHTGS